MTHQIQPTVCVTIVSDHANVTVAIPSYGNVADFADATIRALLAHGFSAKTVTEGMRDQLDELFGAETYDEEQIKTHKPTHDADMCRELC